MRLAVLEVGAHKEARPAEVVELLDSAVMELRWHESGIGLVPRHAGDGGWSCTRRNGWQWRPAWRDRQ